MKKKRIKQQSRKAAGKLNLPAKIHHPKGAVLLYPPWAENQTVRRLFLCLTLS